MIDPNEQPDAHAQDTIEALLSPLKRLEPTLESRLRNRMAVADELQRRRFAERDRRKPWWARMIPVPLPVAAALLVVIGLMSLWGYRGGRQRLNGELSASGTPHSP